MHPAVLVVFVFVFAPLFSSSVRYVQYVKLQILPMNSTAPLLCTMLFFARSTYLLPYAKASLNQYRWDGSTKRAPLTFNVVVASVFIFVDCLPFVVTIQYKTVQNTDRSPLGIFQTLHIQSRLCLSEFFLFPFPLSASDYLPLRFVLFSPVGLRFIDRHLTSPLPPPSPSPPALTIPAPRNLKFWTFACFAYCV